MKWKKPNNSFQDAAFKLKEKLCYSIWYHTVVTNKQSGNQETNKTKCQKSFFQNQNIFKNPNVFSGCQDFGFLMCKILLHFWVKLKPLKIANKG